MSLSDFLAGLLLIVTGTILSKKIEMLVHKLKDKLKKKKGSSQPK